MYCATLTIPKPYLPEEMIPRICLGMIVKDESHIIKDTLTHLLKYFKFSYWVISDTGSTDGTQQIIKDFFQEHNIPGELDETPWRDFGTNRTIVFEKAFGKSDYVFVWDADDEIKGHFYLPETLDLDGYHFTFGNDSGLRYKRLQLFKNTLRWKYEGVLHEYPVCTEKHKEFGYIVGDYYFISGRKGSRNKDPKKYEKDAAILSKAFEESVAAGSPNTRYCFYTAQSYASANDTENAILWYKKNLTLQGWAEEKYLSCLRLFEYLMNQGKEAEALFYCVESIQYVPDRLECVFELIKYYCIKKMPQIAMTYYSLIQEYFETKYIQDTIGRHLFARKEIGDFHLPYFMIIVGERTKHYDIAIKNALLLFKANYTQISEWHIHNVLHNLQFLVDKIDLKNTDFLEALLECRKIQSQRGIKIKPKQNKISESIITRVRPGLIAPHPTPIQSTNGIFPRVLLSITTCKRLDLFQQTMNSLLRTWKDLFRIEYWLCVDDNSSEEDRAKMRELYPWFDFRMKTPEQRGHRESMNIIWDALKTIQPVFWIHLEDDWLFFKQDNYVTRATMTLDKYKDQNIHQILFNRNYAELYADHGWSIQGGKPLDPYTLLHVKDMPLVQGPNSCYWPHYSFRPSVVRVKTILELGNYDSPNTFFERDYADRWHAKGYQSAFFDTITCLHIGKLTSDKSGSNAYTLNQTNQFTGGIVEQIIDHKTFVVNLKRRQDRKKSTIQLFQKYGILDYLFFDAVDGRELQSTQELVNTFYGNDFGSKRGVIGCALSHLALWKSLLESNCNYYIIFEDDIRFTENFKEQYENTKRFCSTCSLDILFFGYTSYGNNARTEGIGSIKSLDMSKYVGGTFGYCIKRSGAEKMINYISTNGIKHGIDYLFKIVPGLLTYSIQPHIVTSEWVTGTDSLYDSDVQKDYTPLVLTYDNPNWTCIPGKDSGDGDIKCVGRKPIHELLAIAEAIPNCVAFNTLGFLKSSLNSSPTPSKWMRADDAIYIRKDIYEKQIQKQTYTRVKMLCNWCSSEQLCKEWEAMSKGNRTWNTIQITSEDTNIDYWVIINKPPPGANYDPKRTIVFQMEPWCGEAWQNWGVKTWGEWARPDPAKFLQVRSHETFYNNAFWQLSLTYSQLKALHPEKTMGNQISTICSTKYFDPGHKFRLDFLKYIESKNDPDVQFDFWNTDNKFGFKNFKGGLTPHKDKENGLVPYKYYFMCENNVEKNFITEKIWEPLLTETLVFYWGCPNVADYIDPRAYVQLDMTDFEASFQIVKKAIQENWWEQRLPYIRAEKQKVLEYYQFFPTIERIISDDTYSNHFTDIQNPQKVCFIHSCSLPTAGTDRLDMLVNSLKGSGLANTLDLIVIQNCGPPLDEAAYKEKLPNLKILQWSDRIDLFELPTIRLIHWFSQRYENTKLLYLHTKGISYPKGSPIYKNSTDWIKMMLYFLVEQWRTTIPLLDTYDTVGCNYSEIPVPHWSGNFWWATTNYIRNLPIWNLAGKMDAERWLHCENPTYKSLHQSGANHFHQAYPKNIYA